MEKSKKALDIIKKTLVWVIAVLAIFMMIFTVVSVTTFNRADRKFFCYKAFIVLSDSMSATDFDAGDLILVKEVDPSTLKEGDIISYQSTNTENYGEVVTHKIRKLTRDIDGNPGFITYGTTTDTNDENIVTYGFVVGKYEKRLAGVGRFFQFLKTTPGYIIFIFSPILLLILMQGINSVRLFRLYKAEQMAEIKAEQERQQAEIDMERERLEAERAETRKMMAELIKLKKQLDKNGSSKSNRTTADIDGGSRDSSVKRKK